MMVASDPGRISLLPALPSKWTKGTIEGVLCRGQVEVKSLSWDNKNITVSLLSAKNQKLNLVMPSDIVTISTTDADSRIEETGVDNSRNISLKEGKIITLNIDIR
jgi:alpha-L-fucosidase 2